MPKDLRQTLVSSTVLASGRAFTVRRDVIALADGRQFTRDVVVHPGAVVIAPVLPDGRVVLVRQWRHAAGEALLELPAGTLEPGEAPEATAHRELQEEAGYRAGRLTRLAEFWTAPGFCTERMHLFLAQDLTPARLEGDEDEEIEVEVLPLAQAVAMALAGGLRDAKTICGILLAAGRLGVRP